MFYEPGKTPHNLPRDPFKSCVVPRPIGWISTISPDGKPNLAPYSQFTNLTFSPPYVMFSANQTEHATPKDTVLNTEATGVFCWNITTYALREAVNVTGEQVPHGVDEFDRAGLESVPSRVVRTRDPLAGAGQGGRAVPMVNASPIRFECEYYSSMRLPGDPPMGSVVVVIGRVVGIHIAEEVMTEGKVDLGKVRPIARCGYYEYCVIDETFEMIIPGSKRVLAGLEGNKAANEAETDTVSERSERDVQAKL